MKPKDVLDDRLNELVFTLMTPEDVLDNRLDEVIFGWRNQESR